MAVKPIAYSIITGDIFQTTNFLTINFQSVFLLCFNLGSDSSGIFCFIFELDGGGYTNDPVAVIAGTAAPRGRLQLVDEPRRSADRSPGQGNDS